MGAVAISCRLQALAHMNRSSLCHKTEPQPTHAAIMVRFAWDCLKTMNRLVSELEATLGPDTGVLSMRFGLHSGPVTAGVLRGGE